MIVLKFKIKGTIKLFHDDRQYWAGAHRLGNQRQQQMHVKNFMKV